MALALGGACAEVVEEVAELPVEVADIHGRVVRQPIKLTIWRDDQRRVSPFLVLNHGRAVTAGERQKLGRAKYSDNSKYFVALGFAVFVPTRVGYGVTGGEDVEDSGSCMGKNYAPVYRAAAQQSLRVIEYAKTLPYIDANRGIIVGQSFGGMTSITLAAMNVSGVLGAINFAGGGGGNPQTRPANPCRPDLLKELFAAYGAVSRTPTLWLYSENDQFMGIEYPRAWFNGFVEKGGNGTFIRLPPLVPDGHPSFTRNPAAWRPAVEAFLKSVGF